METNLQEKKLVSNQLGISGLGGWLILVQIGLYLTIALTLVQLFLYLIPSYNPETWNVLTSRDSDLYHFLWGPVIIFETVYSILLLVFLGYILYNFYGRKWILPRLMIIFYAGSLFFGIIDYILLQQIPMAKDLNEESSSIRELVKSAITCLIWIPYFLRSVRVKNTFVR